MLLIKVISLVVRLFSRPMVNQFKAVYKSTEIAHPIMRKNLIAIGQAYNTYTTKAQRVLMHSSSNAAYIKPLTEPAAIESGIELIGEGLLYGTLATWGLWELYKHTIESQAKEDGQVTAIANIQTSLEDLNFKSEVIASDLASLQTMLNRIRQASAS